MNPCFTVLQWYNFALTMFQRATCLMFMITSVARVIAA